MKRFIKVILVLSAFWSTVNISGQSHGWTVNPNEWDYDMIITVLVYHGTNEVTTGTLGAFVGTSCRGFIDGTVFPFTGKTIFILRCYSDQVSGETLTFKYFDPTDNTYYDIKETWPFISDNDYVDAENPIQFHTMPLVYAVTGGGSYCAGGAGLPVGLADSEVGVTYTLYEGANAQTPTVAGTGSAISFANRTTGTYTVKGSNSGGTTNMSGSAIITETPSVSTPVFILGSSSIRCQGEEKVTYTATASNTTGITYSLDASSLAGGNTIDEGTGVVTYAAGWSGASIITASAAGCNGPATATHTATTNLEVGIPVFILGATSTRCQGAGTVTYTATAANTTGITYSLDAASITGGNSINPGTGAVSYVAGWSGTSTITASAAGCNGPKTANHTVTITPSVGTPVFTLGSTSNRCQGAETLTYTATASNTTGITYSLDAASLSGGNTINPGTGEVTWVADWNTTSVITASAAGCNGPRTATHTVNLTPQVSDPVFNLGATSTRCQGPGTLTYAANASNSTGITYSLDPASLAGGNTINSGTGAVTYNAVWNGTTVITASAAGCGGPKTATHTVTVNAPVGTPSFTLGATSTRCQGSETVIYAATASNSTGITYSLDNGSLSAGNTINSSTGAVTYTAGWTGSSVITASAAGCNGPATSTHTVTITPSVTTPVFALGSSSGRCQGAGTVTYTATANNTTGITYSLDGASVSAGNNININTGAVTFTATWSGSSVITASATGCNGPAIASHTVTTRPTPTAGISGTTAVCRNALSPNITFSNPQSLAISVTYSINNVNQAPVSVGANTSAQIPASTSAAGVFEYELVSVTYQTAPACPNSISGTATVTVNELPSANAGAALSAICEGGTSAALGGSVGGSATGGTWSTPVGGTFNPGATTLNATWTPPAGYSGTATLTLTTSGGSCGTATASKTQVVSPPPTANAGATLSAICEGGTSAALGGSVGGSATGGTWSTPAGGTFTPNATTLNATWTPPAGYSGTATLTLTTSGGSCGTATASKTQVVNPLPTASAGAALSAICQGGASAPLGGSVGGSATGGTWSTPAGGTFTPNATTLNATWTPPAGYSGTATLTLTTSGGSCGTATASKTQLVNPLPNTTLTSSDIDNKFCAGTSVTFTALTGGSNYNFLVDGSGIQSGPSNIFTTNSLTNGQVVSVTITTSAGCTATSAGIINIVNPLPFITISTNPTCAPDLLTYSLAVTVGSGTVTSSSGTVTNTGGNIWTITGVLSGVNITVKVTDSNGCENTLAVTAPNCACPPISAPVSGGNKTYCEGSAVPSVNATVNAGETVDWYSASSGGTLLRSASLSYTPSGAGTFYAEAKNTTSGCVSSTRTAITVTMNLLPTVNAGAPLTAICEGGTSAALGGSIGGSATGGTWSTPAGGTFSPNATTLNATWTPPAGYSGTATLTLTTSGGSCGTATASKTQVVNALPIANAGTALSAICEGETSVALGGSVGGSATGGTWSTPAGGTFTPNATTLNATWTPPEGYSGIATLTLTTSGGSCGTATASKTQVVNELPIANAGAALSAICQGGTSAALGGSVGGSATGGTWSTPAGGTFIPNATTLNATWTPPAGYSGTATLTLTTSGGSCGTATASKTQVVNALPTANAGAALSAICQGGISAPLGGSIGGSATGGTWTSSAGGTFTPGATTLNATWTPPAGYSGTATLTLTTSGGSCGTATANKTQVVNPLPSASLSSSDTDNKFCAGTSVTFTAAAGGTNYNFLVDGSGVQSGTSRTYMTSTLTNGQVVSVIVSNSAGCTATSTGIINIVNSLPFITISTPPACSPDLLTYSLAVTVGSGTVTSSSGTVVNTGGNVWTITGVLSGVNITVKVTDSNGCENTLAVTAPNCACPFIPAPVSGGNKTYCEGSAVPTVNATVNAGETVDWYSASSGGTLLRSASLSYTPAGAGTFYAEARNTTSGCVSSTRTAITVTMNLLPTANAGAVLTAICEGGTSAALGGSIGGSATGGTWSTPAGGTFTPNATTLNATWTPPAGYNGTATLTLTTSGGSCGTATASKTQLVNALPTANAGAALSAICQGGTSVALGGIVGGSATGGTWSTPAGGTFTPNATTLNATWTPPSGYSGTATLTLTTNGGSCGTATASKTQLVNPLPNATLTSSDGDNKFCAGTSVTFTAPAGAATYNFLVDESGVQSGASRTYMTSTLTTGQVVSVTVISSAGCTATSAGIINIVYTLPFITISTPPACATDLLTYSLGVTVNSGTVTSTAGTVTNSGSNVWNITGVQSGLNISVKVTDANGCENSLAVTAPNCSCPPVAAPVSGGDKSYCAGSTIPAISATVLSGETVDWYSSASGGTPLRTSSLTYTPSAAGTYYAGTRNTTTGCTSSTRTAITITMLPLPTASAGTALTAICQGGTSVPLGGSVGGSATGGTWSTTAGGTFTPDATTLNATWTPPTAYSGTATLTLRTSGGSCGTATASKTQVVSPLPTANAGAALNAICQGGTSAPLGGSVGGSATGGTWSTTAGGTFNPNATTLNATWTPPAGYSGAATLILTTSGGSCGTATASKTQLVNVLPTADAGPELKDICQGDTTAALGGIVGGSATGGTWSSNAGGSFIPNATTLNARWIPPAGYSGTATLRLTTIGGSCGTVNVSKTQVVNPRPTANAGSGGNECDLNFRFSAVPSIGTGTWTQTSGPGTSVFSPNANTYNATVTVSEYGTYTYTWTEVSGDCSNSRTITVNFYQQPVAGAGTGGNNCGLEFYLNGSLNVGTGTWTKVSGPGNVSFNPSANTPNAAVTVTAYGSYTFRWTVVNGTCSHSATVSVSFIQQPAANAGPGGSECDNDFVFNAVLSAGTGTWTKVSGPGDAVFDPDNHNPKARVTVSEPGTYNFGWTVVNSTCTSTDVATVIFHELPLVNAGNDTAICRGDLLQLRATGTGTFLWTPADSLSDPGIFNPTADPTTTTTYKVTLTDQYGCKNSDEIVIDVREMPVVDAGQDQVLDYLFSTALRAGNLSANETGTWSVTSGTGIVSNSSSPSTTVSGLSVGTNQFRWTVSNGACPTKYDLVTITVNDLQIPSLITPNGDAYNEYFKLRGLQTLGKTELVVFDRRGAQVYKNSNYDNSWNGVDYNGNELPEDTYFYVIKAQNGKRLSGYIVIKR